MELVTIGSDSDLIHAQVRQQTCNMQLPSFERPPVKEVVCGLTLAPLTAMLAPHLGALWEKYRSSYTKCSEVSPLVLRSKNGGLGPRTKMPEFADVPPLPRIWFLTADETALIQIQRDRFIHNWRKVKETDSYPRFGAVMGRFKDHFKAFCEFVESEALGKVAIQQCELAYVNHIAYDDLARIKASARDVFPDFKWQTTNDRFLPAPEQFHWISSFMLPNEQGQFHSTIKRGKRKRDLVPIIHFELAAFSNQADRSPEAAWAWFDVAHEWIVRGFVDLTKDTIQRDLWGRTQ